MRPRFALARRKAAELLEAAEVDSPPVNLEALAHHLGAHIKYQPFDGDLSGMVTRNDSGDAIIGVNSAHSLTRQRFTIAHELGHLLLHTDAARFHVDQDSLIGLRNSLSGTGEDVREVEANQFAANLLMPVRLLEEAIDELPDDVDPESLSSALAKRFRVSAQAMAIRLAKLGIIVDG